MTGFVIKWTNRVSNETGFVKCINAKNKYFENTYDKVEAKVYKNKGLAASAIKKLIEYGEGKENDFEAIQD